ncbi:hypothetical protein GGR54DRAFT_642027 [Hypoxylon sp. NC1633]|nr:hypothetical protein GGR54DRAFT_642027 [Hypoxylon sp. NC1633]
MSTACCSSKTRTTPLCDINVANPTRWGSTTNVVERRAIADNSSLGLAAQLLFDIAVDGRLSSIDDWVLLLSERISSSSVGSMQMTSYTDRNMFDKEETSPKLAWATPFLTLPIQSASSRHPVFVGGYPQKAVSDDVLLALAASMQALVDARPNAVHFVKAQIDHFGQNMMSSMDGSSASRERTAEASKRGHLR